MRLGYHCGLGVWMEFPGFCVEGENKPDCSTVSERDYRWWLCDKIISCSTLWFFGNSRSNVQRPTSVQQEKANDPSFRDGVQNIHLSTYSWIPREILKSVPTTPDRNDTRQLLLQVRYPLISPVCSHSTNCHSLLCQYNNVRCPSTTRFSSTRLSSRSVTTSHRRLSASPKVGNASFRS